MCRFRHNDFAINHFARPLFTIPFWLRRQAALRKKGEKGVDSKAKRLRIIGILPEVSWELTCDAT